MPLTETGERGRANNDGRWQRKFAYREALRMIEPIPDDCLPPQHVIDELLSGPKTDSDGKIVGGVWAGMTAADVLADRDAYNHACGE